MLGGVPSYATLDAPVRTLASADEELILQVLCVIFHLMQHFGCTSECVHMRTSLRLFHSLFLMVSSRSFVIEVAPSHVHDAEEEEQIIALRPKADFPRCTGQSQVRMRLEGMTLCMYAK